jgi:hypothetical protein
MSRKNRVAGHSYFGSFDRVVADLQQMAGVGVGRCKLVTGCHFCCLVGLGRYGDFNFEITLEIATGGFLQVSIWFIWSKSQNPMPCPLRIVASMDSPLWYCKTCYP